MELGKTTSAQESLTATSKLFSSAVLHELARKGRSPLFSAALRSSDLQILSSATARVRDVFDDAFASLSRGGSRDEYVYKSALVRKILLGKHSLRTASVLSEFRVGDCKADLAILNGTSTVYEIKSERDSLARLDRQLAAYAKVFAQVFVVTADTHLDAVLRMIPEDIGIMRLNDRFQMTVVREAHDVPERTSPLAIFDSIRTEEAGMILHSLGLPVPQVPNTQMCSMIRREFMKLEPRKTHDAMVCVLKRTRNQVRLSELLSQLPNSLHTVVLSVPLRKFDHARLVAAVETSLKHARTWG